MDKKQLLELKAKSHLTPAELRKDNVAIGKEVGDRLEKRAAGNAITNVLRGSEKLARLAGKVAMPAGSTPERRKLRVAALKAVRDAVAADPALAADPEVEKHLRAIEESGKAPGRPTEARDHSLAEAARLDEPVAFNPAFARELDAARLYKLSDAANLGDATAKVVIDKIGSIAEVTDERLGALVKDGALAEKDAAAVGLASSLYTILDDRAELVAAAGNGLKSPAELAKHSAADWERFITASKTRPPGDISSKDYAALLQGKVERLFPAESLAVRNGAIDAGKAFDADAGLEAVRKHNPGVPVAGNPSLDGLDLSPLSAAQQAKAAESHAETVGFANRFAGMRIASVLDDPSLSKPARKKEVTRRAGLASAFLADNSGLLSLDLTQGSGDIKSVTFPVAASASDKTMLLAHSRTYQRAIAVTDDLNGAEALVNAGYHSALSVASSDAATLAKRAGIDAARAEKYYRRAKDIAVGVTGHFGTVIDAVLGGKDNLPVGNTAPPVAGFLKEIPGFADFFGNQDYCSCEHCKSILSPAAYFVDLMGFIDEHVTQAYFAAQPAHVLNLKARRPDLWTVELTCENTNNPVPYLLIINEILENAVATDSGFTGSLSDRAAIGAWVYKTRLPDAVDSFGQPLNLPFEEMRTFLRHFGLSLGDLGETGGASGNDLARLRLGLSPKEHDLITTPRDGLAFLKKVYGLPFAETGNKIDKFEAGLLLKPMAIGRAELDDLIATRFVTSNGSLAISIKGAKRSAASIQNDVEYIQNLSREALDRMHRFVRLRKAIGWKIGELDIVLAHFAERGIGAGIDGAAVRAIAQINRLQQQLKLPVEELTAMWSNVPRMPILRKVPLGSGAGFPKPKSPQARFAVSLFDRQFNQTRFAEQGGQLPQDNTLFLHPALADTPPANPDPHFARLLAAIGASEGELLQLIAGLAPALGIDPAGANEADRKFGLSLRNLTLLYRHMRLVRLLRMTVPELFALSALLPTMPFGIVDGVADLAALLGAREWLDGSGRKVGALVAAALPASPPFFTSAAAVTATAAGQAVSYTASDKSGAPQTETVTFAAHADLPAIVADWNGQAQHGRAYRSDGLGMPDANGTFLSIRGLAQSGANLQITADSAGMFGAALPPQALARPIGADLAIAAAPTAEEIALTIANQCRDRGLLVFADTVFTFLAPFSPRVPSRAAFTTAAGGETVDLLVTVNGAVQPAETISLAPAADLDAAIADWNAKSTGTLAYRSDAKGRPAPAGTRLAITTRSGTGGNTSIAIAQDSASIFTSIPAAFTGGEITAEQSRAIVAANAARFDALPEDGRYRLKPDFDPAAALTLPGGMDSALEPELRPLLLAYHSQAILSGQLPGLLGFDAVVLLPLAQMLGVDLARPELFAELGDVDGGHPILENVVERLRRLDAALADASALGPDNLDFLREEAARFGIADFDRIEFAELRRVDRFKQLVAGVKDDPEGSAAVREVIGAFTPANEFAAADQEVLGQLLGCSAGAAQALQVSLSLAPVAMDAFAELRRAAEMVTLTGTPGNLFTLAASTNYDDLAAGSAAIQAGLRAQYENESEWEEKVEPLNNALLSLRRDGLVAYLIHTGAPQFDEVNDLYHYYLLDVQVEGCMRTSRVAAAIDSAQLYVNRCQMNLEESPPGATPSVHVLPEAIPDDEWSWRRNYRVWEASRKIFLYPENFIEPELRDDKTPLFKAFEDDLLSKDVTDEAILEAFGRYLRAFDELAHLTIAGAYHEKDEDRRRDVLHLVGVTADDPPTYYYRRVEDAHYGAVANDRASHWGAWEQLNVQIPVRKASPVMHRGQLYLFWIRYVTTPQNKVSGGESKFSGYHHKAYVEFTKRKIDGSWTTPQKLRLNESPFKSGSYPQSFQDDGVILDPIVPKDSQEVEIIWFDFTLYSNFEPLYDQVAHEVPKEDYQPRGFQWDQLYPASSGDLTLRGVNFQMWSNVDLYRLEIGEQISATGAAEDEGVPWLNPAIFFFVWLLSGGKFDLTALLPPRIVWSRTAGDRRELHTAPSVLPCFDTYTYATVLLDQAGWSISSGRWPPSIPMDRPGPAPGPCRNGTR